ncbi:MAG: serine/threonine-protein kinase [Acidobacteriota bacterium]|nr:serine/threonine-protein kinase [Acidobacteriota bacterium]
MNPERWQLIEAIFSTVVDRSPAEREAHLTRVCGGDEELRREVMELLEHETKELFLEDPIKYATFAVTREPADEMLGHLIGPYRLIRLVGRGGMGVVYEAVRDDRQFDQRVALKIIKRGMDSDFVRERFLRERQILASLDHPHIARLLDGGSTADGLPYFAMEFVEGEPITDYCRQRKLSLNAKLKLFRDVCAAVQHAHQKLAVHRDLKPSNIMVTTSADGKDGTPKLLDFGIAKLLAADPGEAVTRTETALRLMTPDYASPEQVRGGTITTATDVYALGIVLYELLTGQRPYQFDTYAPAAIERAICDTEAARPSEMAGRQSGAAAKQARELVGDLDNIVMMALRKEPARRYQSVEKFSDDIRRYLEGLPITARADTFTYRAGKFVRRHRVAVAAAVLVLLSLLGGIIATTFAARQARAERDRANQAAASAEAATKSLVAMFEFADPGKSKGNAITAKELLDQGAEKVVRELNGQPALQAKLLDTIGLLYHSIGLYDRGQPLLEEALKLRRQTLGNEHADVATSLDHLAEAARVKDDFAKSESLFREALAMRRKLLGAESREVADSLNNLALVLQNTNRYDETEQLLRESLAIRHKLLGQEHSDVATSLSNLGLTLYAKGRSDEAEQMFRESLAMRRKLLGADHHLVAWSMSNLAARLHRKGQLDEAERLHREALAIRRQWFGTDHPDTLRSSGALASVLRDKGDCRAALPLFEETISLGSALLGPDHLDVVGDKNAMAPCLTKLGRYREAEEQLLTAYAKLQAGLPNHWQTKLSIRRLAELYEAWGKPDQAAHYRALLKAN